MAVVTEEAERVRDICYLELGSVHALIRDLKERNVASKQRVLKPFTSEMGLQSFTNLAGRHENHQLAVPRKRKPGKELR